jgi:hypothetical protein
MSGIFMYLSIVTPHNSDAVMSKVWRFALSRKSLSRDYGFALVARRRLILFHMDPHIFAAMFDDRARALRIVDVDTQTPAIFRSVDFVNCISSSDGKPM